MIEQIINSPFFAAICGATFTVAFMKNDLTWIKQILIKLNDRIEYLEKQKMEK